MNKRERFLQAARSYLGTPFHHQGRVPGVGLDCAGVVVCAAREAGMTIADQSGYAHQPFGGLFEQAVLAHADPVSRAQLLPGDLLMFAFGGDPQHIAVVQSLAGQDIYILHAHSAARKVVEQRLDGAWESNLRGCFRLRQLEG